MRNRTEAMYQIQYLKDGTWREAFGSGGVLTFFSDQAAQNRVTTDLAYEYPGRLWRTVKRMPYNRCTEPTGWQYNCVPEVQI